ncbi:MAG: UDP-N-acetylmuramoyl-L-alanine--D-glutamate ligase [Chloroflexia bacterium]|nr:UDP-N-acetylmuramoyl-L-alanine--D-glutamate ligase [Chloroflexia bacterium]
MGLGRYGGGAGVARYLAEAGAIVTVTDVQPQKQLTEALAELADLPIRYVLGGHDEADFLPTGADLVVRNPGVPRRAPPLELARRHGVPVEMEMTLFFRACPAPIIGVTGTKGKTTVSTLIAAMLRAGDPATVLAGNMGVSALGRLDQIGPRTPVVIELSSWQLEGLLEHRLAPAIAILTLIAEDHLNTYDGFADYAATKRGITRHQTAGDTLVVNADDAEAWWAAAAATARVFPFGLRDRGGDGVWWVDGAARVRRDGETWSLAIPDRPALAGSHHRRNVLAAIAAAVARGAGADAIRAGLESYRGLRDRMEVVATIAGITYINDTTATAPVAAAAGLAALARRRVHLLAGGADKQLDPEPLVAAAVTHAHAVYLFAGSATAAIDRALREQGVMPVGPFESMDAAVAAATLAAGPGDVVLLSPGCASFGLFQNEFDRGEQFRQAVRGLEAGGSGGSE